MPRAKNIFVHDCLHFCHMDSLSMNHIDTKQTPIPLYAPFKLQTFVYNEIAAHY